MINRILLIDDDKINNFLNYLVLIQSGITKSIITLTNGQLGIDFLKDVRAKANKFPHLILLDINMPVLNGFEFMEEFRDLHLKKKDNVHIAVLTTSTNSSDLDRMRDLGITHFLKKPLSEHKLKEMMESIPKFICPN